MGSVAGWVWGLIHPLVLLVTWTYVFSVCLKQTLPKGQPGTYPLFLFAGMLPWLLFSDTVQRSSSSLVSHLLALALMVVATLIWVHTIGPALAILPLYMLLLGMLAVGIGWVVAALQVYLRDTAQFVTVILTAWFWMTPIFIFEDQVPPPLRILVYANPLASVVRAYRQVLLSTQVPGWREAGSLAVVSVAVFFLGGLVFRHLKRGFADVL